MPSNTQSSTLKQGTLPFTMAKHGAAGKSLGKPTLSSSKKPSSIQQKAQTTRKVSTSSEGSTGVASLPSDNDDVVILDSPFTPSPASTRTASSTTTNKSAKLKERSKLSVDAKVTGSGVGVKRRFAEDETSDEEEAEEPQTPKGELAILERSGRLGEVYRHACKELGGVPLIHARGQTKVHHILRIFDNSYEYGPCIGMTRLERWERAHAIGLNPPPEVREILLTKQAQEDDQYKKSVFYGEV